MSPLLRALNTVSSISARWCALRSDSTESLDMTLPEGDWRDRPDSSAARFRSGWQPGLRLEVYAVNCYRRAPRGESSHAAIRYPCRPRGGRVVGRFAGGGQGGGRRSLAAERGGVAHIPRRRARGPGGPCAQGALAGATSAAIDPAALGLLRFRRLPDAVHLRRPPHLRQPCLDDPG